MSKAFLLVIEDDPLQRKLMTENLEAAGYAVLAAVSRKEALELIAAYPVAIAVVDYKLGAETGISAIQEIHKLNPLITSIMVTAYGNIENAVEAIKLGAYDYIVKPIDFKKFLLIVERALERHRLKKEVTQLQNTLEERFSFKNFIIASSKMEEVARLISKASKSDANVLILGETGTGKDLVARTIHYTSRRSKGPYLAVNLPSLPETLIESELFGAEKGAYTGAHERKIGKFEAASSGTLFLDEIGDLSPQLQVKLLRFLQDKEFTRLGSTKPLKSDVRITAATNKDLEKLVAEEKFRADLFFRLNVIRIHVPPLRERKEDIPPLADFFLNIYSRREGKSIKSISAEAMAALMSYSFPGNIRELENTIERAVVFSESEIVTLADLPVFLKEKNEAEIPATDLPLEERVRRLEVREIKRALLDAGGIKSKAARALGITERILSYKMKIYEISPEKSPFHPD